MKALVVAALMVAIGGGQSLAETAAGTSHPLYGKDVAQALRQAGNACTEVTRLTPVKSEYDAADPVIIDHAYCDETPKGQWYAVRTNMLTFGMTFEFIDAPSQEISFIGLRSK